MIAPVTALSTYRKPTPSAPLDAALSVVVARGDHDHPGAGELGDDRLAEAQAEVAVGGIADRGRRAPPGQTTGFCLNSHIGTGGAPGIGDVERVVALAAAVQAADQDRLPRAAGPDVAHDGRAIDVELVPVVVVVVVGELVEVGQDRARDHRPGFLAAQRVGSVDAWRRRHAACRRWHRRRSSACGRRWPS